MTYRAAVTNWLKPTAFFIGLLIAWQYGLGYTGVPKYVLPLPSEIASRFAATLGVQLHHLGFTALTTMVGLLIALVFGVLLALLVIYLPGLKSIVLPILAAFNSIPKIAIAPLFIIW